MSTFDTCNGARFHQAAEAASSPSMQRSQQYRAQINCRWQCCLAGLASPRPATGRGPVLGRIRIIIVANVLGRATNRHARERRVAALDAPQKRKGK
jgi:hypothetical protein